MGLLRKARQAMRESSEMARLLTLPASERAVVAYAEDTFTHIQLRGYLEALWADYNIPYHYVTSDPGDPLLNQAPEGATVWFIRDQLARFLTGLECDVFLTTMPDLGRFHIPPPKRARTVYAFHSLNSTHTAYRKGAFDNYDQFLCTGPHHVAELTALRSDNPAVLSETGYYKLDLIRQEYADFREEGSPDDGLVVVAPSWGPGNLLKSAGKEIVHSLLKAGLRVIVRPHPQFFHTLYPEGEGVVRELVDEFGQTPDVEFELSIDTQGSFLRSGLMISDWSGAAFEFSLGTLRPALFIDTPQKIFNEDWERLGLPAFERAIRDEVGEVVPLEGASQTGIRAVQMLNEYDDISSHLRSLGDRFVFNLGTSASAGANAIYDVL